MRDGACDEVSAEGVAEDERGETEGGIVDFGESGADDVEEEFEGPETLAAWAACDEVGKNARDH